MYVCLEDDVAAVPGLATHDVLAAGQVGDHVGLANIVAKSLRILWRGHLVVADEGHGVNDGPVQVRDVGLAVARHSLVQQPDLDTPGDTEVKYIYTSIFASLLHICLLITLCAKLSCPVCKHTICIPAPAHI